MAAPPYLKPLILAGGLSSRMGSRKELLRLNHGEPMYMHLASLLHEVCPDADTIYLSLRDRRMLTEMQESEKEEDNHLRISGDVVAVHRDRDGHSLVVRAIYDYGEGRDMEEKQTDIGPAGGLLAAHRHDPRANWLVVACDYPLLTAEALVQLRREANGELVCFQNADGFCEPLLAIWTPEALRELERNVQNGILGPSAVVKKLRAKSVIPRDERWLFNANTPEDWQRALRMRSACKETPCQKVSTT